MTSEQGMSEDRRLKNGEIVYLKKHPGEKWRIEFYECNPTLRVGQAGGLYAEFPEVHVPAWGKKEFETPEDAIAFIEEQIKSGTVPGNRKYEVPK